MAGGWQESPVCEENGKGVYEGLLRDALQKGKMIEFSNLNANHAPF